MASPWPFPSGGLPSSLPTSASRPQLSCLQSPLCRNTTSQPLQGLHRPFSPREAVTMTTPGLEPLPPPPPEAEGNRYHSSEAHTLHMLSSLSPIFQTGFFYAPHPQNGSVVPKDWIQHPSTTPPPAHKGRLGVASHGSQLGPGWIGHPPTGFHTHSHARSNTPKPTSRTWLQHFPKTRPDVFPLPGSNTPSAN